MCSLMDMGTFLNKKESLEKKLETIRRFRTSLSNHWIDQWALNHWKEIEDAVREELTKYKLGDDNEKKR